MKPKSPNPSQVSPTGRVQNNTPALQAMPYGNPARERWVDPLLDKGRPRRPPNYGMWTDDPVLVNYTHTERTLKRFSCVDLANAVATICKDRGYEVPDGAQLENDHNPTMTMVELNERIQAVMLTARRA